MLDLSTLSETTRLLLEIFGYIGSAVVVASFAMTSVRKLRIINGIGAILSVVYALLMGTYPFVIMNGIIAFLDFYQLYRLTHIHEVFEIVSAKSDGAYFKWFVEKYKEELKAFDASLSFVNAEHVFFYVRDNEVAGLLAYDEQDKGVAHIRMDYVIPKYRDFRIGNYFFGANNPFFTKAGIHEFVTETSNPLHEAYLRRITFSKKQSGEWVKGFVPAHT